MAVAILAGLIHRNRSGEGQWIDMACTEAGTTMNGPALLDATVNDRPMRRAGMPDSNHSQFPSMAPHNIYASAGDDNWVAIACRDDSDWHALAAVIDEPWSNDERFTTLQGRLAHEDELDKLVGSWTVQRNHFDIAATLVEASVPASAVQRPVDRIDHDANTAAWGLWPVVHHSEMGDVRVDGIPVHMSATDWHIERGGPCLGEHNDVVFGEILGLSATEIRQLRDDKVI